MQEIFGIAKKKKFKFTKKFIVKELFVAAMLVYPLAQFAVFYVYMNFNNMLMAFKGMRTDGSTYWTGLTNFYNIINGIDSQLIFISLKNNLKMFFLTLVIGMPLNILFGYYLYRKKPGTTAVRIVYMLPHMVSGVVMTLLFMKFVELGLPVLWEELFGSEFPNLIRANDTAFGVQVFYVLWLGFSSSLIIYSNAMVAIDPGIIEAGRIDGTTVFKEIIYIVVPLIFPTLSTYMITGVASIFTLSGSLYLFYGLNDVPHSTYMMGFYMFKIAMQGDLTQFPMSSALSIMITAITVPLTLLTRWAADRIDPMRDVNADIA